MQLLTIVFASLALFQTAAHARPVPKTAAELRWLEFLASELAQEPFASTGKRSEFDFSGQVRLPGCSGSLINFGQSASEPALLLTNAHCVGMLDLEPNVILVHKPYTTSGAAYVDNDRTVTVTSTEIVYGAIQVHDVAIVQLAQTYQQLLNQGVKSRKVATGPLNVGDSIIMASSYFRTVEECKIVDIIHEIHEDRYINQESYKYRDCHGRHGTSGSPLISASTGEVVGVNYTGNDDGERCTMDNPCEVDASGEIRVEKGATYGDPVHDFMSCLNSKKQLDLRIPGCKLPH